MTEATALTLKRPLPPKALISLVAMIDVLLILLVFFMVTSTYLDLDMIPAVSQQESAGAAAETPADTPLPVLVRIGADGRPVVQGRAMDLAELDRLLRDRLATSPATPMLILPTGLATTQALVSVMDTGTRAGVLNLRVIRLEERP